MTTDAQVLDALEEQFQSFGATHFLANGVPLPGRSIDPLMLRMNWGDLRHERAAGTEYPMLRKVAGAQRPFPLPDPTGDLAVHDSPLITALRSTPNPHLIAVPIRAFPPYQGVVVAGGASLSVDSHSLMLIEHVCIEAFRRLFALGVVKSERAGDLSPRERRVVELSAVGRTASEIAEILEISQRTVHAHLQNASEKLHARNKTHTVVEALRYGQISI